MRGGVRRRGLGRRGFQGESQFKVGASRGGTGVAICEGTRNAGQGPSEGSRNENKNTGSLGGGQVRQGGVCARGRSLVGRSKTSGQNRVVGGNTVWAKSVRG